MASESTNENEQKEKLCLHLLIGLTMGCNNSQIPTSPSQGTPPAIAKIAYIGNETCKQCHPEKFTVVPHTNHFQAFKPLSDYPLDKPLGPITVFDSSNTAKPTSTTLDLSKAKVYGVMMDDYVIAEVPPTAGFKEKIYRVAALKKTDDKWQVQPSKQTDFNKDGKPDWSAESFTCGKCHAPGIENTSPNYGISCESYHGPHKANANGDLLRADKPADICVTCHAGKNYDPDKIMWKNPSDPYGHITRDHSFGAIKYEDLGDDPATKPIEIKNPTIIDLIKKSLPEPTK